MFCNLQPRGINFELEMLKNIYKFTVKFNSFYLLSKVQNPAVLIQHKITKKYLNSYSIFYTVNMYNF